MGRITLDNATEFFLEDIQPYWIQGRLAQAAYVVVAATLVVAAFVALGWALAAGVALYRGTSLAGGVPPLVTVLPWFVIGVLVVRRRPIRVTPVLGWSWRRARANLLRPLAVTALLAFPYYVMRDAYEDTDALLAQIVLVLLLAVSVFGVLGLDRERLPDQVRPNFGIRRSAINASLVFLAGATAIALVMSLLDAVAGEHLAFGLAAGQWFLLLFVAGKYGGLAVLQHVAARLILAIQGILPLRLVRTLDGLPLVRRVGGGYMFFHRRLAARLAAALPASVVLTPCSPVVRDLSRPAASHRIGTGIMVFLISVGLGIRVQIDLLTVAMSLVMVSLLILLVVGSLKLVWKPFRNPYSTWKIAFVVCVLFTVSMCGQFLTVAGEVAGKINDCMRTADHLEKLVAREGPDAPLTALRVARGKFVDGCQRFMTPADLGCVMAARDAATARQCLLDASAR